MDPTLPISKTRMLELRGQGYKTEELARSAADEWSNWLQVGLARIGVAGDFGIRTRPDGMFFNVALDAIKKEAGKPVRNDYLGLHIFEEAAEPDFVWPLQVTMTRGVHARWIKLAVNAAKDTAIRFDERYTVAYDTYRAAFDLTVPEVRLVTLVTAVEMLIEPKDRDIKTRELVDTLMRVVQTADCPGSEKQSITGTLNYLYKQSIGQAGRELVQRLRNETYWEQAPDKFFGTCYSFRSRIVHGKQPQPDRDDVIWCNVHLERMVGHLLSGELINVVSNDRLDEETERVRIELPQSSNDPD
jgi:hypothetical protein